MKFARRFTKFIFTVFLLFCITVFSFIFYLDSTVSNEFKVKRGGELKIDSIVPVTAVYSGSKMSQSRLFTKAGDAFEIDLKMFGVIPFSTVNVSVVDELYVAVLGTPFGMKLYTEGVLVVDLTEVATDSGIKSPAKAAGIKVGDYIISVNGKNINTNEDLSNVVENSDGAKLQFLVKRNGKSFTVSFAPEYSSETESYKIGIWIRDSSAGIGTLTFYSPASDVLCGLGHGICDEDTGSILELNSGEIVKAEIVSVDKGETGAPGQLNGSFKLKSLGKISLNCECGVYSEFKGELDLKRFAEIALKQEVQDGKAQILCTVSGEKPELFDCEIKHRSASFHSKTQNLVVTITDERLLEITGGIVQGMSGSPLLQNGKLIGAVTHVLVDNPTKGYAIFAENMLETAQNMAENNKLKNAS